MSVWRQDDALHSMSAQTAALRQQILEAAIAAMARKGFHETSIADIATLAMDALDPEQPIALDMARVVAEIGALVFFGLAHPDLLSQPPEPPERASVSDARSSRRPGRPALRRKEGAM